MKYDQKDKGLGFDGVGSKGASNAGVDKWNYNQSGKTGLENAGRGPTKGNTDSKRVGINPPSCASGKEQKRNPGGTKEFPKQGRTSFEFPQGPRKGVSQ